MRGWVGLGCVVWAQLCWACAPPKEAGPSEAEAPESQPTLDAREAVSPSEAQARTAQRFGRVPLRYEENRGQHDARARYVARQGALTLFATDDGPELALHVNEPSALGASEPGALGPERARPGTPSDAGVCRAEPAPSRVVGLRIAIEGARSGARIEPRERLITRSNYLIGDDPRAWRTGIPNYRSLTYRGLAPGVDMVLRGSPEGRLEYDLVVAPGTAPELAVRFEGAERVTLAEDGALSVHVGDVVLTQPRPVLYQEIEGARVPVEGAYRLAGLDRVRFQVGTYDRSRPLVIDPVLVYATYFGGSFGEGASDIAVDDAGATYIAGTTDSTDLPTSLGAAQALYAGRSDAFVAKLTPGGDALAYVTYLGGSNREYAWGIGVDGAGAAYVTGYTESTDFPTSVGALQAGLGGVADAYVVKLSPAGSALAYATYLGGSREDNAYGIAVDGAGAAYVTGYTDSTDFPTSAGVLQAANAGGRDVFVAKLDPAGSALAYATYLGGGGSDDAWDIAVDGAGAAYVAGYSGSPNFPTSASPLQAAIAGGWDSFVAKLAPDGSALSYGTYLGGSRNDYALRIVVDGVGAAYVTGETSSTDFPTSAGALQTTNVGGVDAFVVNVSPGGSALAYATYLGGSGDDSARGIALDGAGAAYVTGYTYSANFPITVSVLQAALAGAGDAFFANLNPGGTALIYSTYLGGSDSDGSSGVVVDGVGAAYIAGGTVSTDFPTSPGTLQPAMAGGGDAFVVKVGPSPCGNGAVEPGEECDGGVCCTPSCTFRASTFECRRSAGGCDVAETCPGDGTACPTDLWRPAGYECRPSAGDCDVAEYCDGTGARCPANVRLTVATVCRPEAGPCDREERCTSSSDTCPADQVESRLRVCARSADVCSPVTFCDGERATCEPNVAPAGTPCRASAEACDAAEACDGLSGACPPDAPAPDGTSCADAIACNGSEVCSGGACAMGTSISCDDGDACTADACEEPGTCVSVPVPGCCNLDVDCDDANGCTADVCDLAANRCTNDAVAGCVEGDAGAPLDDGGVASDAGTTSDGAVEADAGVIAMDAGEGEGEVAGGCGCRIGGRGPRGGLVLELVLALASWRGRRRRAAGGSRCGSRSWHGTTSRSCIWRRSWCGSRRVEISGRAW